MPPNERTSFRASYHDQEIPADSEWPKKSSKMVKMAGPPPDERRPSAVLPAPPPAEPSGAQALLEQLSSLLNRCLQRGGDATPKARMTMLPNAQKQSKLGIFLRQPIWRGTLLLSLCLVISIGVAYVFRELELPGELKGRAERAELLLRLNRTLNDPALLAEIIEGFGTPSLEQALSDFKANATPNGWDGVDADWDLTGSLFFAFTLATSIGYGFSAPVTPHGRGLVVVYVLFAIPLCLGSLALISGEVLKSAAKRLAGRQRDLPMKGERTQGDLRATPSPPPPVPVHLPACV